jgi:hypothetical protein
MSALTRTWLEGPLVSAAAVQQALILQAAHGDDVRLARAVRQCRRTLLHASLRLGPASGASGVWAHCARPLMAALGWQTEAVETVTHGNVRLQVARLGGRHGSATLVVLPWGAAPSPHARSACRAALRHDTRWVMLTNGCCWRWFDASRPFGGRFTGLRFDAAHTDERVLEALWLMGRADGPRHASGLPVVEQLANLSGSLELVATRAIRDGVSHARACLAGHIHAPDHEVLTLVFRWIFLLLAEARGLAPVHNPVYRHAYAVSTIARHALRRQPPFGLWDSLTSTGLLAHAGSTHPALRLTALNGALFDPEATPHAARASVPDAVTAAVLTALTSVEREGHRRPIAFADLDVEHLGTIYEDVLARPAAAMERKRTGTYYTPRELADHLVARTLAPLTEGREPDAILALRVLDPAMGSGAILASAARYLMAAVEAAWARQGRIGPLDVTETDRADTMRHIVERCLYGVDRNPRAVQIARLSLWLTSMARERPLTFLDNHLRCGNSLIGTTAADIVSRMPGRAARPAPSSNCQPALFDLEQWDREAAALGTALRTLAMAPSMSAGEVQAKARKLEAIRADPSLASWRRRADQWCGAWMTPTPPAAGLWRAIDDSVQMALRGGARQAVLDRADQLRRLSKLADAFHWPFEFPDVLHGPGAPGFDAVIANPPWEMLRADLGSADDRSAARARLRGEVRFLTGSGSYGAQAGGHANLYRFFVERMLQLCAPTGRIGIIAPWGLLSDYSASRTRERLFRVAAVDEITAVDNARRLFPIHRSVRFALVTATSGRATRGFVLRTGVTGIDDLHGRAARPGLWVDLALVARVGGPGMPVPCLRGEVDLHILDRMMRSGVRLDDAGWKVGFSRELNATDDRQMLHRRRRHADDLRAIGGRDLAPFRVEAADRGPWVRREDAARVLPDGRWLRWRLAYRDVASAGNRMSLIAALVPPAAVTTHTLFVLRQSLPLQRQLYLLGVFNSLVANWFVRLFVGTHVTSALAGRLPVPPPDPRSRVARRVARLAGRLGRLDPDSDAATTATVALQCSVARLYGLTSAEFDAVIASFPLLPESLRRAIGEAYARGG